MLLICGVAAGASLAQTAPKAPPAPSPQPALGPGAPAPAGTIDLRPKFRTGQQIRYIFDQTAKNTVKSQDPNDTTLDQDQKQAQRLGLVMKVVQAGDEGATIQVVYESIKVTLDTPDGIAEYDSTKPKAKPVGAPPSPKPPATRPTPLPKSPAAPPPSAPGTDPIQELADLDMNASLALIVGPMVGTTITVKTDRAGAITSVSGGDALGGGIGGIGGAGGLGGMGGSLVPSPSAVANWLVAGLGGPGNRGFARVGETWTNNDALTGTPRKHAFAVARNPDDGGDAWRAAFGAFT
jgi:hypothetical protein